MAIESTIQKNILNYLNGLPNCIAENVSGGAAQKGRPDINCCWNGRCVRIEVKSEETGYKATKIQLLKLKKWQNAGALCMVVNSLDDVKRVIK